MFKKLSLCLIALNLTSCATLFSSSTDTITFKSEPPGAMVMLNGREIGRTPLDYELKRDTFKHPHVMIRKKGYESQKYRISKTLNNTAIFNLTSILSWGTDALTGKMIEYSPKAYFTELKKKDKKSAVRSNGLPIYVVMNHQNLLNDLARGEGEYLKTYAKLSGIDQGFVVSKLKPKMSRLAVIADAADFYAETKLIMQN